MAAERALRILIVDDERAARDRLEDLLSRKENVEIVGTATNGRDAIRTIRSLNPDLVFLDMQMPGLTGLDVVQQIGPEHMPAVIFATAYDQYALKAFDLAALDYLLKPFDDDRFDQAFARARKAITLQTMDALRTKLSVLFQDAPPSAPAAPPTPRYLERIAVEMRGQMRIVPVQRIDFITASGDYVELHAGEDTFLIREQMQALEERLDPDLFFRIHRSTIVQLDRIDRLLFNPGGDYAVRLTDDRRLKVSRGRWEELAQRLGVQSMRRGDA